jgi:hypothetical protein
MKPEEQQDSTHQGEETDRKPDEEKVEYHDPQADAREAIAGRRRQELRAEGVDIPEDDEPSEEADEKEAEAPEGSTKAETEETEEMVEIKVDGQVEKVKKSEVEAAGSIRALQKERAADKRLQEAARRKADLDAKEQALAEREKGLKKPDYETSGEQGRKGSAPARLDRKKLVELTNKIQYGDAEEAAEAMEEILSSAQTGSAPRVDTQQIVEQVRADIKGSDILERFAATPEDGGFGDLQDTRFSKIPTTLEDKTYFLPAPLAVARQEVDRLIKDEGADPFAWETYEKAGNYAREQFGLQTKNNPTRRGNSSGKHERKRSTDHPRGATPPAGKEPDVEKSIESSRRSAINDMMAARSRGAA